MIYRFNEILLKIPTTIFFAIYSETQMEFQGNSNSVTNLEKKEKLVGPTLPDFKMYKRATVINTMVLA